MVYCQFLQYDSRFLSIFLVEPGYETRTLAGPTSLSTKPLIKMFIKSQNRVLQHHDCKVTSSWTIGSDMSPGVILVGEASFVW
jgi:hypothetical protein